MTAPLDRARLRELAENARDADDALERAESEGARQDEWQSAASDAEDAAQDLRNETYPERIIEMLDALDAAERERDALAADARRYRWLRDWMERRHLIRSEFCKPPDDAPVGDYVLIWTPYGTSKPIGWGLTADEAIDRAMRDDALDGAKGAT